MLYNDLLINVADFLEIHELGSFMKVNKYVYNYVNKCLLKKFYETLNPLIDIVREDYKKRQLRLFIYKDYLLIYPVKFGPYDKTARYHFIIDFPLISSTTFYQITMTDKKNTRIFSYKHLINAGGSERNYID